MCCSHGYGYCPNELTPIANTVMATCGSFDACANAGFDAAIAASSQNCTLPLYTSAKVCRVSTTTSSAASVGRLTQGVMAVASSGTWNSDGCAFSTAAGTKESTTPKSAERLTTDATVVPRLANWYSS